MIEKIKSLLPIKLGLADGQLPDIYLDFSSEEKQYALVALRLRNLTTSPISLVNIDFVPCRQGNAVDVSDCVIGEGATLKGPFSPNSPGVVNIKGVKMREKLAALGYKRVLRGKLRAYLADSTRDPIDSPEFEVDFDRGVVRYRHLGRDGKR
ncbi:MAG TPA: hypothetical protein VGK19_26335 [Capsulimonadaceae bacterium]|jgi:hypothetical protein